MQMQDGKPFDMKGIWCWTLPAVKRLKRSCPDAVRCLGKISTREIEPITREEVALAIAMAERAVAWAQRPECVAPGER